jgi:hypothetical protein
MIVIHDFGASELLVAIDQTQNKCHDDELVNEYQKIQPWTNCATTSRAR